MFHVLIRVIAGIVFLIFIIPAVSTESRFSSGVILGIEDDSIILEYTPGSKLHIGFSCESEACKLLKSKDVGDEVILTLGSIDGKNHLLDIRGCHINRAECDVVREMEIEGAKLKSLASDKRDRERQKCYKKMDIEAKNDDRYVSVNWFDKIFIYERYREKYRKLEVDEKFENCVTSIVDDHYYSILDSCKRNGCDVGIGGGCEHIVGYRIEEGVQISAIKQCENTR